MARMILHDSDSKSMVPNESLPVKFRRNNLTTQDLDKLEDVKSIMLRFLSQHNMSEMDLQAKVGDDWSFPGERIAVNSSNVLPGC